MPLKKAAGGRVGCAVDTRGAPWWVGGDGAVWLRSPTDTCALWEYVVNSNGLVTGTVQYGTHEPASANPVPRICSRSTEVQRKLCRRNGSVSY